MRTESADTGIFRISERNRSARTPPSCFGKRFNRTPHSPLQNLRSRQLCRQNSIRTRRFKRNNLLRNRNVLWLYPCQKNQALCSHFGTISFYKLLTNFNIMQIIFLSEIIFLALVQINGKVLIDFRNLFTEISAARMNYKKICSVR